MTKSPLFTDDARRARLARRHRLIPEQRCDDVLQVCRSVVGLHASDPVTVYLSAAQRMRTGSIAAIDDALYEQRSLVRHHAMRRTLWVLPLDSAMAAHSSTTIALVRPERARLANALVQSGITDDPHEWIDTAGAALLKELATRGEATARELGQALPDYTVPVVISPNAAHGGPVPAHTRLLLLLGFVGAIVRTRPIGTLGQRTVPLGTLVELDTPGMVRRRAAGQGRGTVDDRRRLSAGLRPGHRRRRPVVDRMDEGVVTKAIAAAGALPVVTEHGPAFVAAGDVGPDEARHTAVGGPASRARPDDDGLEAARLVRGRRAGGVGVRPQRQCRPHDLGRRTCRRCLGTTCRRNDRNLADDPDLADPRTHAPRRGRATAALGGRRSIPRSLPVTAEPRAVAQ